MAGARLRLLAGATTLVTLTLLATLGMAQEGGDPRNISDEYYDALNDAECMSHHEADGFAPFTAGVVQHYRRVPIGEPVELEVRIRNPWDHTLFDLSVTMNTSQAPDVEVVASDLPDDLARATTHTVGPGAARAVEETFPVEENATRVSVRAELVQDGLAHTLGQAPTVHVALEKRDRQQDDGTDEARVTWDKDRVGGQGFGTYTARAWVESDLEEEYTLRLKTEVTYGSTATEHTFFAGDGIALRPGEGHTMRIPIVVHGEEANLLDLMARGRAHWDHQPSSKAADDGDFVRFTTTTVRGGDQFVKGQSAAAPVTAGTAFDIANLFTKIVGFVSILLVPISMVTGGLFGKGSRRWMNRVTGGPKRRVLWHSSMSWLILVTASLHFLLALVETKFRWTHGILWGGVGWALLVVLGVTGYWQVRMIRRWDYKTWRRVHLAAAVGVFVFGILHMLIDGDDLMPLRQAWPWMDRLVFG